MIVRILGEGQLVLEKESLAELNQLDDALMAAVEAGQQGPFETAMKALLGKVRELGTPLPVEELKPSDFILPSSDSSLDEVRDLLSSDGLIPG
jgi:predicted transcriptional regulator